MGFSQPHAAWYAAAFSAELISLNDGYGLGALSEECLESNNKDIRNFLEFPGSRKTEPLLQLNDVMAGILERSDPRIFTIAQTYQPM